MDSFETFPEQDEAKRLLRAALAEGPAHAYLLHGPRGVGKRRAAIAFAGELLGSPDRVARDVHPDLYVLEPLGDQIRIDPIRDLRRDLHMRPFEADRRVYLVLRRAPDERGRRRRAPQGSRGAAAVRGHRPRRRRARAAAADDPLALPARAVPPALAARDQGVPLLARPRRASRWRRSRGSPPGVSTAPSASSTPTPESGARRLIELARSVYLDPQFDPGRASTQRHGPRARARGEGAGSGRGAARRRGDGARGRAAQPPRRPRRRARGDARRARPAHGWYRDLWSWPPGPAMRCSTPTGSPTVRRRESPSAARLPSGRRRPCATSGGRSSSTSSPASRSRRCSSGCGASSGRHTFAHDGRGRRRLLPGRQGLLVRSGRARARLEREGDLPDLARPGARARRAGEPRARGGARRRR